VSQLGELDQEMWAEWLAGRPAVIRDLATRFPPNLLYRLRETGSRVTLHSYSEDGTMTVTVGKEFNEFLWFERNVFGIEPEDLEECDLP